ncbi:MAG: PepSY domain-containing protein [Thermaurantiacus sp.]
MSVFRNMSNAALLPVLGGMLLFVPAAADAQRLSRGDMTTRPVTDQELAWDKRQTREVLDFPELLARAERVGQGRFLGSEPDIRRGVHRFKFMRSTGQVVWVDMDARTGAVRAVR